MRPITMLAVEPVTPLAILMRHDATAKRCDRIWIKMAGAVMIVGTMWSSPLLAAADVIGLQPAVQQTHTEFVGRAGAGSAILTNLNPSIGSWYLLQVKWPGARQPAQYHLEVPSMTPLTLSALGIAVGSSDVCSILDDSSAASIQRADSQQNAYVPLCGGTVQLRKKQVGDPGPLIEWGANFLRMHGMEAPIDTVKQLLEDQSLQSATLVEANPSPGTPPPNAGEGPQPAAVAASYAHKIMRITDLDLALAQEVSKTNLSPGQWTPLLYQPGVFFSAIQPGMVNPELARPGDHANPLGPVESQAVTYFIAFDLSLFTAGWAHGTNLPGVGWSTQFPDLKTSNAAGPDGFANLKPLVTNGILNPVYLTRLVATLSAGFQRYHGAFGYGPLSKRPDRIITVSSRKA